MELNINVEPEQINKMISEAILQSAIGEQLRKVIADEVGKLSRSYDNPIQKVVEKEVLSLVATIVRDEFGEQIKTMVRAQVTEQFTEEFFDKLWKMFADKYYR